MTVQYVHASGKGKVFPLHAMKTNGRVEVQLHSFLTSALDEFK
jgi:hypothetical protein